MMPEIGRHCHQDQSPFKWTVATGVTCESMCFPLRYGRLDAARDYGSRRATWIPKSPNQTPS